MTLFMFGFISAYLVSMGFFLLFIYPLLAANGKDDDESDRLPLQ